jgi:hypothetical protein
MKHTRRSKHWWQQTVEKWRRSRTTAEEFAAKLGVKAGTLRWWSYALKADARPRRAASAIVPIEIAVPANERVQPARTIELATGKAVLRFESGTDVGYIAAPARALG